MAEERSQRPHKAGSLQHGSRFTRTRNGNSVSRRTHAPSMRRTPEPNSQAAAGKGPYGYNDPRRYTSASDGQSAAEGLAQGLGRRIQSQVSSLRSQRAQRRSKTSRRWSAATDPDYGSPAVKSRPRRHHAGRTVLAVLLGLLTAAIVAYVIVLSPVDRKIAFSEGDRQALSAHLTPCTPVTPYYALLLGSDSRNDGEPARTDTIMLARVDPLADKVTLVSIPRDTKVELEGHGTQKINAAYAFGGVTGITSAVGSLTNVNISQVALIDFDGLASLIDAIGGVTVTVPVDINDPDYTGLVMPAGVYEMDGNTAMLFSRVRHGFALGDYQRQANQRILIQAIVQKLRSNPTLMPAAADSLGSVLKTTYHCYDLIPVLARMAMQPPTIYSASIPSTTQRIRGVDYVIADGPATATLMQVVNAGEDPATVTNGLQEDNNTAARTSTGSESGSRSGKRK